MNRLYEHIYTFHPHSTYTYLEKTDTKHGLSLLLLHVSFPLNGSCSCPFTVRKMAIRKKGRCLLFLIIGESTVRLASMILKNK